MNQLIVRRLDPEVVKALRARAARRGRSAEAEHRAILSEVLLAGKSPRSLKDLLLSMPDVGRDEDFKRAKDRGRPVSL